MAQRTCSIDGCEKITVGRGLCRKHYQRWWKHGDPLVVAAQRRRFCEVPGCDRPRFGQAMCEMHYGRVRSYGSTDPRPDPRRRQMVDGQLLCSRCMEWKEAEAFHRDRSRPFARASACRRCLSESGSARARSQLRRARKAARPTEKFTDQEIFERDGWRCGICGRRISRRRRWPDPLSVSLDHIVPLALGGSHTRANAQASHLRCNQQKCTGGTDQLRLIG